MSGVASDFQLKPRRECLLRSLLGQKPVIGHVEKLKSSLVLKAKVKGKIVIR